MDWLHLRADWLHSPSRGAGFIRRADEASPPVDEAIQPTDEARPIGHYICFSFFLFFQIFFLSAARVLLLESA